MAEAPLDLMNICKSRFFPLKNLWEVENLVPVGRYGCIFAEQQIQQVLTQPCGCWSRANSGPPRLEGTEMQA